MKRKLSYLLAFLLLSGCASQQQEEVREVGANGLLISQGTMEDGYRHGTFQDYDSSGVLKSTTHWYRGALQGDYILYFPNGRVKETGNYALGLRNGTCTTYDSLGGFANSFFKDGLKTGEEQVFDHDRILTHRNFYSEKGQLMYSEHYDVLGEITKRELTPFALEGDDTIKLGVSYAFNFKLAAKPLGKTILQVGQINENGDFTPKQSVPMNEDGLFSYFVKPEKTGMQHSFYRVLHTPHKKDTVVVSSSPIPFFFTVE